MRKILQGVLYCSILCFFVYAIVPVISSYSTGRRRSQRELSDAGAAAEDIVFLPTACIITLLALSIFPRTFVNPPPTQIMKSGFCSRYVLKERRGVLTYSSWFHFAMCHQQHIAHNPRLTHIIFLNTLDHIQMVPS